jgi:hypothetical protein
LVDGLVDRLRTGQHGAHADVGNVGRDLVELEGHDPRREDDHPVINARLNGVVILRDGRADGDGAGALDPVGGGAREAELAALEIVEAVHGEIRHQVIAVRAHEAQHALTEAGEALLELWHLIVPLGRDLEHILDAGAREGHEKGQL